MFLSKIIDNKKYMWDGENYTSRVEAENKKNEYEKEGFEAIIVEESDKFQVFSRRLVKEIKVEGSSI